MSAASALQAAPPSLLAAYLSTIGMDVARLMPASVIQTAPRGLYTAFQDDIGFAGVCEPLLHALARRHALKRTIFS
jgi:hypothetical protein